MPRDLRGHALVEGTLPHRGQHPAVRPGQYPDIHFDRASQHRAAQSVPRRIHYRSSMAFRLPCCLTLQSRILARHPAPESLDFRDLTIPHYIWNFPCPRCRAQSASCIFQCFTRHVGGPSGLLFLRPYNRVVDTFACPSHFCAFAMSLSLESAFVAAAARIECTQIPIASPLIPVRKRRAINLIKAMGSPILSLRLKRSRGGNWASSRSGSFGAAPSGSYKARRVRQIAIAVLVPLTQRFCAGALY